ncbi:enoyl-CoA hydratase [Comamonas thiooxydans]|uniref:enoyl-CoA hydratase/isomerase family protein n=1 Tax=Comamonas thiooxydans TaxID=363952 RepID=UPI0007C58D52|nr:enoyl-CoA hydratase-related protein [Comamonas thiooxydans]OAD86042.1 enoyl-CoA hydratase [Comamonas thiooxydans]UBQ43607.1 enoyl-CoA hydratase/isomerase family protein [Comamonas thiooxydans]
MSDLVLWEVRNGVGHMVLNQPERGNVISTAMAHSLKAVVGRACNADIGALLISASGKQFCVGGDISEFGEHRERLAPLIDAMLDVLNPVMHQLASLPLPVISAVQGPVGGGGIGLALCADLVLASRHMFLRGGYSAIGLSPDLGVSGYLTRRAGAARAKYILMSNRAVTAEDCLRMGLVDELHEPEQLLAAATALAEELAGGPTNSLAGIKSLCDSAHRQDLQQQLGAEREAMLACARSGNSLEGVTAFLQKRKPVFQRR